ncbi:hypothetical protein Tco_0680406 [Tanacetum coccineum]|uniref:Uncharacterized protein n=1 Tax=Tanacetum coccineum TaxID=301880 RepID=A0ABQ4XLB3_9ASTR
MDKTVSIYCDRDRGSHLISGGHSEALGTYLDMCFGIIHKRMEKASGLFKTLRGLLRACASTLVRVGYSVAICSVLLITNSYYVASRAAPLKQLYGRKCRSTVCWTMLESSNPSSRAISIGRLGNIVQSNQRMQAMIDKELRRSKSFYGTQSKVLSLRGNARINSGRKNLTPLRKTALLSSAGRKPEDKDSSNRDGI